MFRNFNSFIYIVMGLKKMFEFDFLRFLYLVLICKFCMCMCLCMYLVSLWDFDLEDLGLNFVFVVC